MDAGEEISCQTLTCRLKIRFADGPDYFTCQLQSAIAALPPVAPGKVRVFRGQTKDYDEIKPASYRVHLASRAIWRIYSGTWSPGARSPGSIGCW